MTTTIPQAFNIRPSGPVDMMASEQWRTRPVDECFWNLEDMHAAALRAKENSIERDYPSHRLAILPSDDARGIQIRTNVAHAPLDVTYHAFTQLAGLADGAPAGYLRKLPAALAADCLTVGLARRARSQATEDVQLLAYNVGNGSDPLTWTTRALCGPQYSRFWTADLTRLLLDKIHRSAARYVVPPAWTQFGGGVNPSWTGPTRTATQADCGPHTRVQPGDIIRPAGAYYGTRAGRDSFIFLVNTEREIGLPGGGTGFRFLLLWNSETGAASIGGASGLCDIACGNHIIWGASQVKEFRFRHVGEGLSARSYREIASTFNALEAAPWETNVLQGSASHMMGDNRAEAQAKAAAVTKLPLATIVQAMDNVSGRDYGRPLSAYAIASALTEHSQTLSHAEDRIDTDRAAGRLYSIAA